MVVRHALPVAATVVGLRRTAVVSQQSAAVLLGLPMWAARPGRVHITRLRDDEVTAVDGIAVTDVARTVLDLPGTRGSRHAARGVRFADCSDPHRWCAGRGVT